MSEIKGEPVSTQIRAPKVRINGSEPAVESPACRADKNLKKSTMELGGSGAFIAPEDRAQIWRSPKQMPTIKADPSMNNVSINAQVERMTQPFWEYPNAAPSADLYQNVMSQLLALFRTQGCALPVAEELAQKVTGELTARVREVLRRPGLAASWISGVIQVGDLKMDLERHMLWRGDDEIHLSPKEFDLLAFMMKNADALLTHVKLLRSVWGLEYGGELEYLRTYICTLRKKIEKNPANPEYIVSEPWIGYRFRIPAGCRAAIGLERAEPMQVPRFSPGNGTGRVAQSGADLQGI